MTAYLVLHNSHTSELVDAERLDAQTMRHADVVVNLTDGVVVKNRYGGRASLVGAGLTVVQRDRLQALGDVLGRGPVTFEAPCGTCRSTGSFSRGGDGPNCPECGGS